MVTCWGNVLKKEGPVVGGVGDRGRLAELDEAVSTAVCTVATTPPIIDKGTRAGANSRPPPARKTPCGAQTGRSALDQKFQDEYLSRSLLPVSENPLEKPSVIGTGSAGFAGPRDHRLLGPAQSQRDSCKVSYAEENRVERDRKNDHGPDRDDKLCLGIIGVGDIAMGCLRVRVGDRCRCPGIALGRLFPDRQASPSGRSPRPGAPGDA
jgi:hypothetical protein